MGADARKIFPILLSGGAGSRLWPLSREECPKQLLPLVSKQTLLQQTAMRAANPDLFEPLTVIGNVNHRFQIAEQLREVGARSPTIVLEPCPRNTAAAAAIAALLVSRADPDGVLLIMPADHRIDNVGAFLAAIETGIDAARDGTLVLFGMMPDAPATGYGYIRAGAPLPGLTGISEVAGFFEKPNRETAAQYLAHGEYLWNSGIFLLSARAMIRELSRHEPEILEHAGNALDHATQDADFLRLDEDAFGCCRSTSIDYAIMERTDRAAVVPADFGWTDLGSWSTLWEIADRNEIGNILLGDVLTEFTSNSYIRSEGPLIATIGIDGLIVVATPDAVLVAEKGRDQEVKRIVERLRAGNLGRL